jgi:hypothetical protein
VGDLVEMLSEKHLALNPLICLPVSYCKYIRFSKLFFKTSGEGRGRGKIY